MSTAPHKSPENRTVFSAITSSPYILLIAAPTFWGGNVIAGKFAVGQIDPYLFVLARWIGAVLLLLLIALPHVKTDWLKIKPGLGWLIFYGALGYAVFNLLMYQAAYFTAGVNASIEQAAIPVLTLLANFVVFKVRAKLLQVVGLMITIVGVIVVATHGDPGRILALDVNIGDGMVLIACALYAAYSITLRYKPDIHWLSFIFVAALAAMVTSIIISQLFGGGVLSTFAKLPEVTWKGWLCVAYVMIFPSILAQLAYARGVEIIGPNRASIFINLLPIIGTIMSVILLGEGLQNYHLAASGLVIIGIILAEYAARKR